MAAEELGKSAGTPASTSNTETNVGNGDMAHLIGSVGSLIDSTIVTVQEAISSVSSATGQIIEGVASTIKSEPVQGVFNSVSSVTEQIFTGVASTITAESIQEAINSVSSATGQLIDGVTSTINSQPVQDIFNSVTSVSGQLIDGVTSSTQNSFQELGKLWTGLIENLNAVGSSNQVQNLFNNVSAGLGQLMNNSFMPGMPGMSGSRPKKDVTEIIFTPKENVVAPVKEITPAPKEIPVAQFQKNRV